LKEVRMGNRLGLLRCLVTAILICLAFNTQAGAQIASKGIKAGSLKLYPALDVMVEYDTNVTLAPEDEIDDTIWYVTPYLKILLPMRNFFAQVEGKASIVRYSDFTEDDHDIYSLSGSLGGDFPGGLSFTLADTFSRNYLRTQTEFDVAEYYDTNQLYGRLAYTFHRDMRAELEYFNYIFAYEETNDLDRTENTFSGTFYYKFRPKLSALLEGTFTDYAYDDKVFDYKDNQSWQLRLGLTFLATGKTTGEVRIGYQNKKYEFDLIRDDDQSSYWTAVGKVSHAFHRDTILDIELLRATVESDYIDNPYYLSSRIEADLWHRFTHRISGKVGLYWRNDAYPNETTEGEQTAERDDDYLGGIVSLSYDIRRWLSIIGDYRIVDRDSNLDVFDYGFQRIGLTVRAAW
jgi:hypothetical protein